MFLLKKPENIMNDGDEFEIDIVNEKSKLEDLPNSKKITVKYNKKYSCFVARESFLNEINIFEVDRNMLSSPFLLTSYIIMKRCDQIQDNISEEYDKTDNKYQKISVYHNFEISKDDRKEEYVHKIICYSWGDKNGISGGAGEASKTLNCKPEEVTIDHINGKKYDNRPENLEYVSGEENIKRITIKALCGINNQRRNALVSVFDNLSKDEQKAFVIDIIKRVKNN